MARWRLMSNFMRGRDSIWETAQSMSRGGTWQSFFADIERCKELDTPWTLQLRDPLSNSFVSSVLDNPRKDPRMQVSLLCCATIRPMWKARAHVAAVRALLQSLT